MANDIDTLIENNISLVRKVANKHFAARLPDDDLVQCGLIGLWEAATKWTGKGDFKTFARTCIYHNMLDYARGLNAKKRAPCEELTGNEEAAEDDYSQMEYEDLCSEFSRVLLDNTLEYIILTQLALKGEIQPVADFLGIDGSEVRKVAKRAYRAVKQARE